MNEPEEFAHLRQRRRGLNSQAKGPVPDSALEKSF